MQVGMKRKRPWGPNSRITPTVRTLTSVPIERVWHREDRVTCRDDNSHPGEVNPGGSHQNVNYSGSSSNQIDNYQVLVCLEERPKNHAAASLNQSSDRCQSRLQKSKSVIFTYT